MKNEFKTIGRALWTIIKSMIKLIRYALGYPVLALALLILPPKRKAIRTGVKNSKLARTKIDYIMDNPNSKKINVKHKR